MAGLSYSKFKNLKQVSKQFSLKLRGVDLFTDVITVSPSDILLQNIEAAHKLRFGSEKERSERLVAPILAELSKINDYQITIYSGRELNVDPENGLNGECDYLLSFGKIMEIIEAPVFTAVEAKKNDQDYGIAQCAAQLVGVQKYNQAEGYEIPVLYGCSTTGTEWKFMKLEGDTLFIDSNIYPIDELPKLLGVLQYIATQS
ncbi:MAG: hypothetical protein AAF806_21905, partial [Bacteroidota bacterium]